MIPALFALGALGWLLWDRRSRQTAPAAPTTSPAPTATGGAAIVPSAVTPGAGGSSGSATAPVASSPGVRPAPGRCVALRTSSGFYVRAGLDTPDGRLDATATGAGPWETFRIDDAGDGRVALRAANGRYVAAEGGGHDALNANRTAIGAWEAFRVFTLGGGRLALQADDGAFVVAEDGGGNALNVNRPVAGPWEEFGVEDVPCVDVIGQPGDPPPDVPPPSNGPAPPTSQPPPLPGPAPNPSLLAWRGAIATVLWGNNPYGPRPNQADNVLFTAQYDSPGYDAGRRADMRARYRQHGYTHWTMGPVAQTGYHGQYPDTNWISNPGVFADRCEEIASEFFLNLMLLPDNGLGANGRQIDRDFVVGVLEPIYRSSRIQAAAKIVTLAWEPDYDAQTYQWGVQWMARVFPNAVRCIHFPSGRGAPGVHADLASEGGPYPNEASLWVPIQPYIHVFLMQDTWAFEGNTQDGRTGEQQFQYDLLDKIRRFRYGRGPNAPTSGPEVDLWNATRGASGKGYQNFDGEYLRHGASDEPIKVVGFEYGSYSMNVDRGLGDAFTLADRSRAWGRLALEVPHCAGYGDGG